MLSNLAQSDFKVRLIAFIIFRLPYRVLVTNIVFLSLMKVDVFFICSVGLLRLVFLCLVDNSRWYRLDLWLNVLPWLY